MTHMKLSISRTQPTLQPEEIVALQPKAAECLEALYRKTGKGNDFLGWLDLSSLFDTKLLNDIKHSAQTLSKLADVVVVVGIGGSYLGAKAVIEALSHSFSLIAPSNHPQVLFVGQNISEEYIAELLEILKGRSVACVAISKSGTTTEPAIALRFIKKYIEQVHGKDEVKKRIVAITDASHGALKKMAEEEGYETFVIPDDVGGRFSVMTPVGLLPIAVAGFDIERMVKGVYDMELSTGMEVAPSDNSVLAYAIARNLLYQKGKKIELLANFNPKLRSFAEWWKQLYGESEGKDSKGIFPASVDYTTDLHSMGQYIQNGERILFETVISVTESKKMAAVPMANDDSDGLNYLAGRRLEEINKMAELGTILAHADGGVPNIHIEMPKLDEYNLGQLICFFEKACGVSGYLLGVNPFDQPGVEAYKRNMFALLGKPGFEKDGEELRKRL
ncbi:MAG: glucose-6-phosphate isomerase [Prevotellaceae bacterium]|nr:glucose-6-phosphate isomerase [Prevotellaceae bacterium]